MSLPSPRSTGVSSGAEPFFYGFAFGPSLAAVMRATAQMRSLSSTVIILTPVARPGLA